MLPSSIRGRWWTPTQPVEVTPMRNELIGLWEVERYGSDSFVDVDYVCVYGLRPREWYGHGVRLLGRTVVECTRDRLAARISGDVAACRCRESRFKWLAPAGAIDPLTPLSTRAVPLQAMAIDALHRLPPSENPILFPNVRGGRIDFRSFGRRHWKPAQTKAGIEPLRHLYDLRHTPTQPSRYGPAFRCLPSRGSWARASR